MLVTSNKINVPLILFRFQIIVKSAHCILKRIKLNNSAVNDLLIASVTNVDFDFDVKGIVILGIGGRISIWN